MRIELLMLISILTLAASPSVGCAIRLDANPPATQDAASAAPLPSCAVLGGVAEALVGRVDSLRLADGPVLMIAGAATVGGQTDNFAFTAPTPDAPESFGDCLQAALPWPTHPVVDLSALGSGAHARPLAGLTIVDNSYIYFSAPHTDGFGSDGTGVARWDSASQRFATPTLLWTADRPSYGSGAAFDGTYVYVFGGLPGGFLTADMFVARVGPDRIAEPGAYTYWQGGGTWGLDPDRAAPFAEGGKSPTVAWNAQRLRWILAYATPLATEITVRSGLGPAGPWSLPLRLGRCALPDEDPGALCDDVVLHPLLFGTAGDSVEIVLSHGVSTFDRPAGIADTAYGTRLVRVGWPPSLP